MDILVEYDHDSHLSLFGFTRYKLDVEAIAKRDVDLVVDGTLLPFARESAEETSICCMEDKVNDQIYLSLMLGAV